MAYIPRLPILDLQSISQKGFIMKIQRKKHRLEMPTDDTLRFLEKTIMENPQFNYADYPQYLVEHKWRMKYIPVESFEADDIKDIDTQRVFDRHKVT